MMYMQVSGVILMFGKNIRIDIFGASHDDCIGVEIHGIKKDIKLDIQRIEKLMERRKSKNDGMSTPRVEEDKLVFESGLQDGVTSGEPLRVVVFNNNIKKDDYSNLLDMPRPSHADYVARMKYGESYHKTGGGWFSGRMTIAMVIVGGICQQLLDMFGVSVYAGISSIGGIQCGNYDELSENTTFNSLYLIDNKKYDEIKELVDDSKKSQDSLGGSIMCKVVGMPIGVGDALYDSLEGDISRALFSIPAIKGVEFGSGFDLCNMKGSQANDEFYFEDGKVKTYTNNNGGINGGISNGMPITLRVAIKPTPSIATEQRTVDLKKKINTTLKIKGRHDVCIVSRAVVVVESMVSFAIMDRLLDTDFRKK